MTPFLTRRGLVVGTIAMLGAQPITAQAVARDSIAAIEHRHGGRLGLFVLDTASGRTLAHRADERFIMCSTFKGMLAALVLSHVDAGRDGLDHPVPYGKVDLLPHSPVTSARVGAGRLPVETLCAAIVLNSDNGAANLLLSRVGGPAALTAYVRGLGDLTTRLDRTELVLNDRSGILDKTTPQAMVGTAQTILLDTALSPRSRALLEGWMIACRTGTERLRASFPRSWTTGDKTGTGDGECNDYAIARRPGRAPLVMAAYHDAPGMEVGRQEAVLRAIGSTMAAWAG